MKAYTSIALLAVVATFIVYVSGCADTQNSKTEKLSDHQLVARGEYLVTAIGCHDCHSPKVMTDKGPSVDKSRMLSGNRSDQPIPLFDTNMVRSEYWILMGGDGTAFVGPWGMSFTANLTPDSATGIGAWTQEQFIKTLRTGKHLGLEGGRDILPPMPWDVYNKLNDEDLSSIFAYLKSLKPVRNKVRTPVPPNEVSKQGVIVSSL